MTEDQEMQSPRTANCLTFRCSSLLLIVAVSSLATLVRAEPDEGVLGKAQGYPVGTTIHNWQETPYRVGSLSALDKVPGLLTSPVQHSTTPVALSKAAQTPPISYRYGFFGYTLDEYLDRTRATGLLILKNGEIVAERYRYGRTEDARFLSFSLAKSVTSMLIGIAVSRGAIASLDDLAGKYAKELAGSPYGETSIRHLLRMSSGLTFSERYDGQDDVARLKQAKLTGTPDVVSFLRSITNRHAPAGQTFTYASAETEVLGRVLKAATGRSMAALTAEWLWQPIGAEHDAFWLTDLDHQEFAYAGFNASLRDWGRLGLLLANDGKVGDHQVVPRDYLLDATELSRQPTTFVPIVPRLRYGYGYQFWLLPMRERTFRMDGLYGQAVFVQPSTGIVMVQTAAWDGNKIESYMERDALWMGVLKALGGKTDEY